MWNFQFRFYVDFSNRKSQQVLTGEREGIDKLEVPIKYENGQLRENIAIGPWAPVFARITSSLIAAFRHSFFSKNALSLG